MPSAINLINDYTFYKIISKNSDIDFCYVGSTICMETRIDTHKSVCSNPNAEKHHLKVYKTIRENGGIDEVMFVEIGYRKQLTLEEAHIIENEYTILLNADLNTKICHLTPEQRDNYNKKYYETHKEHIKEVAKNYRKNKKEERMEYEKRYYESHKEEIKKYNSDYREKNKEKLNEKNKVKHACPCGGKFTYQHKSQHTDSLRHRTYIKEQQQTDTEVV